MGTPLALTLSVFGFCRDASDLQGIVLKIFRALKRRAKTLEECSKELVEVRRTYMISSGMCFIALEALVNEVDVAGLKEDVGALLEGSGFGFGAHVRPLSEEELKRAERLLDCGRS
ncbi:MAG: hypothetical protein GXO07_06565 [Crenarchaeota archaeon]|nr:hypothetical protein [Thermoproteota archaeon]